MIRDTRRTLWGGTDYPEKFMDPYCNIVDQGVEQHYYTQVWTFPSLNRRRYTQCDTSVHRSGGVPFLRALLL